MRIVLVLPFLVWFACPHNLGANARAIVVTTSMLESAAREVLPEDAGLKIVRLIPPSSCPGHFDLNPGMLRDLYGSVVVLRHDYQAAMEQKLSQIGGGTKVVAVSTPGSLLIPANYLRIVEQVTSALGDQLPSLKGELSNRLAAARARIARTEMAVLCEARSFRGTEIIVSSNQKQFCEWLELKVVSVFPRSEALLPGQLAPLLSARAALIIGNLQEGDRIARSLGKTLSLPVAIVSNFPASDGFGTTYDQLLRDNVERIKQAWRKP